MITLEGEHPFKLLIIATSTISHLNQMDIVLKYSRSIAPNSLSIWTHYMSGIIFYNKFKPKDCGYFIDSHAVTAAAGSQMGEINLAASLRNLTCLRAVQLSALVDT